MKTGKNILSALFSIAAVAILISISSCGGGGGGTPAPDMSALLKSGTWKVSTVTVDGANELDMFTGMTLTFTSGNFTSTNADPVWPASGTWTLNAAAKTFSRNDGLVVTVGDNISETTLKLTLNWDKTTYGGGRTSSVAGEHVFTFGK
jgi:hypothetical protein